MIKRGFCAALLGLVFAHIGVANANDGPSYEDTVRFIQSKTSMRRDYEELYYRMELVEIRKCEFEYKQMSIFKVRTDYADIGENSEESQIFNLKDFDPSRVELGGSGAGASDIYLYAREGRKVISLKGKIFPGAKQIYPACEGRYRKEGDVCWRLEENVDSVVGLDTYDDQVNAPKLQSAFKHLINLCGGKSELF